MTEIKPINTVHQSRLCIVMTPKHNDLLRELRHSIELKEEKRISASEVMRRCLESFAHKEGLC